MTTSTTTDRIPHEGETWIWAGRQVTVKTELTHAGVVAIEWTRGDGRYVGVVSAAELRPVRRPLRDVIRAAVPRVGSLTADALAAAIAAAIEAEYPEVTG